ncbi:MAG TPA: M35 family metallo-endopeptidase [Nitrososphaeraceae archaeon]|nr:M35 family metallo-endopeptidase [Nitrososphaeraceae archaeon]
MQDNTLSEKLSVKLELSSKQYKAQDGQDLRFTLTNNSNETLSLLKWQLPLEGSLDSDTFWVKRQEEVAVYLGKVIKRRAPIPEDFLTLDPNESISTDFDLAEAYDISKAGNYTVEFDSRVLHVGKEEPTTLASSLSNTQEFKSQKLRSNIVEFQLLEDRTPKQSNGIASQWSALLTATAELPSFRACTTNQRNQLKEALEEAENIAKQAQSTLLNTVESNIPNARRYKEWFGNYLAQRYNKVKENFDKIVNAIANERIIFNCSMEDCREGVFAYVYPTRPYEIFLCSAFWNASVTGTDSRSGTIVHELSHFNIVAGTDDNVYGQPNCRDLARNSPEEAIANADSHEYFAENTPPLNM